MLLAAIPAVVLGALTAPVIPTNFYKWLIGIILILLGINMLIQKNNHSTTIYRQPHARLQASLFGILGGLMVGVAGMSGGAVILAGLFLLGLKDFQATATSTYVLTFMTITGALFHIAGGQVDWAAGLPLMFGALVGAVIAPKLAQLLAKTKVTAYIKPVTGILLILLGTKSLF